MMQPSNEHKVSYLLSFLALLVKRNGGTLVIENLSEVAGTAISLSMKLEAEQDRVTLRVQETPLNGLDQFKPN